MSPCCRAVVLASAALVQARGNPRVPRARIHELEAALGRAVGACAHATEDTDPGLPLGVITGRVA